MNNTIYSLFQLIRIALGNEEDFSLPSGIVWEKLIDMSFNQGVAAITVDGMQRIYDKYPGIKLDIDSAELEDLRYEWFCQTLTCEMDYQYHSSVLCDLVSFFKSKEITPMLLKGYGLSLYYPIPSHRTIGDIDLFLFTCGEYADQMVKKYLKLDVKQNEDKHSTFIYKGITIENHACFANDSVFTWFKGLNSILKAEAMNARMIKIGDNSIYLPSTRFNSLFLPLHCAGHFVHGDSSIRQLCDWACFVNAKYNEIDWGYVKSIAKEYGFWSFYCCLNGIVQKYLGVPNSCLPDWPRNYCLEDRVLDDILLPSKEVKTLFGKVNRFFASRWKYRMVYKENMLLTSFRLAKSYLRMKDADAMSIWDI